MCPCCTALGEDQCWFLLNAEMCRRALIKWNKRMVEICALPKLDCFIADTIVVMSIRVTKVLVMQCRLLENESNKWQANIMPREARDCCACISRLKTRGIKDFFFWQESYTINQCDTRNSILPLSQDDGYHWHKRQLAPLITLRWLHQKWSWFLKKKTMVGPIWNDSFTW